MREKLPAILLGMLWIGATVCTAEESPLQFKLAHPLPHEVVQRTGVAPGDGYAHVKISGELPAGGDKSQWQYRAIDLASQQATNWASLAIRTEGEQFEATARLAAGPWFRLELRCREGEKTVAASTVEPVGVGEVFLVAGQSYATNCNDKQFQVTDAQERVVAFNAAKGVWQVAHDPQPAPDGSDGGSIWPPLGDALAKQLKVPVGFVNVAVGATSSHQWMPERDLHQRLSQVGKQIGNFRAVLWQQGESDVIAKTTTEKYVANLAAIRQEAAKVWNFNPPWLLAKSTHHPTVYNDPAGEGQIRAAIDLLVKTPDFFAGPDTDTLQGENRGDKNSRRHFTEIGQQRAAEMWLAALTQELFTTSASPIEVGMAAVDITPPQGFPMAGYYHERLAEGKLDSLQAKAIVFRQGETQAALVVCDLVGIATDLSKAIRKQAAEKTGIPVENMVIAATHSHTAPDYMKELYLNLGGLRQEPARAEYIEKLIAGPVEAIVQAQAAVAPVLLEVGAAVQETPVAFNRRFVMRDGSVKTWMNYANPAVVRAAGPIDPAIGLLAVRRANGEPRGVFSNFALHLDTVGGSQWSADYPHFLEQFLRKETSSDLISIFGTGCCGDINHVNPRSAERNTASIIGEALGATIQRQLPELKPLSPGQLVVKSSLVQLPLQNATLEEVIRSLEIVAAARRKETVDFFEHVQAYKKLMLDQMRHKGPFAKSSVVLSWGLSHSLAGVGEKLPVEVTVMTLGPDFAIVCLPGEVFVELGLAIKQGSPFRNTLVVELSNCVETSYIPNRAAYAGGSYEVTNSATQPGSGEMLVEAALRLLREAASE